MLEMHMFLFTAQCDYIMTIHFILYIFYFYNEYIFSNYAINAYFYLLHNIINEILIIDKLFTILLER